MINAIFLPGNHETVARGLTQWDYGQDLVIASDTYVQDETEVHFYQNDLGTTRYIKNKSVRIPDRMLQNTDDIRVYIYCKTEKSGETILFVKLPIKYRPRPTDYIIEDTDEYRRILPSGGLKGQALRKKDDKNYHTEWGNVADDIRLEDGYLQLISGNKPVGSKVRLPSSGEGGGKEIELINDGTAIKWRYTNSNDWKVLVSLEALRGPQGSVGKDGKDGITPEFEIREGHLIAKYEE